MVNVGDLCVSVLVNWYKTVPRWTFIVGHWQIAVSKIEKTEKPERPE
jgi:hypothetical protein